MGEWYDHKSRASNVLAAAALISNQPNDMTSKRSGKANNVFDFERVLCEYLAPLNRSPVDRFMTVLRKLRIEGRVTPEKRRVGCFAQFWPIAPGISPDRANWGVENA